MFVNVSWSNMMFVVAVYWCLLLYSYFVQMFSDVCVESDVTVGGQSHCDALAAALERQCAELAEAVQAARQRLHSQLQAQRDTTAHTYRWANCTLLLTNTGESTVQYCSHLQVSQLYTTAHTYRWVSCTLLLTPTGKSAVHYCSHQQVSKLYTTAHTNR